MFAVSSIPDDVLGVCRRLHQAGHQAHLVGGGIRDLLLGRVPADFDVATNALPDVVLNLFGARFAIPTGLQHGTITVLAAHTSRHVEVTTFRGEGEYLDGRRPSSVSFSATLHEDLARRDFAMNAIAFDPIAGVLTDPFDGQGDLHRRLVKAVGDPIKRFQEDGLRPMRAIRQATQLGFTIDPETLAAIPRTLDSFRKVSAERIRDELFKMLRADQPSSGVRLLFETTLLAEIFPELLATIGFSAGPAHTLDVFEHSLRVLDALPAEPEVRLAGLWHDVGKTQVEPGADFAFEGHAAKGAALGEKMAERLRLSIAEKRKLCDLVAHHEFDDASSLSDVEIRRHLRRFVAAAFSVEELLLLHVANRGQRGDAAMAAQSLLFADRARAQLALYPPLHTRDLAIDGKTLMQELGLAPGKQLGVLLNALLEFVIEDPLRNTKEHLLAHARACRVA